MWLARQRSRRTYFDGLSARTLLAGLDRLRLSTPLNSLIVPYSPRSRHFGRTTRTSQINGRVVFNIGGNKYRLVVWINYGYQVVYIRVLGTHAQYDQIGAQTI